MKAWPTDEYLFLKVAALGKKEYEFKYRKHGKEMSSTMDRKKWAYENILKERKLENRFDNFLRYLLAMLKRKYVNSVGSSISRDIKLEGWSECALVYNPQYRSKHPKLVLHIPGLYETGCDDSPHFVMMAVIAKMILEKDPDFESLVTRKIRDYASSFETAECGPEK